MENTENIEKTEEKSPYLRINYKAPKGDKNRKKYPEARGVKVSLNLEVQSQLVKDICMQDEALLASGRYTVRDILDAKACIEDDGLRVKLCKYLDKYVEGMTGKTGYEAIEIVNRNKQDETHLKDVAIQWAFDSTPVKRVVNRDTRPLDQKLADLDSQEDKIKLVVKELKISPEKAALVLPALEA